MIYIMQYYTNLKPNCLIYIITRSQVYAKVKIWLHSSIHFHIPDQVLGSTCSQSCLLESKCTPKYTLGMRSCSPPNTFSSKLQIILSCMHPIELDGTYPAFTITDPQVVTLGTPKYTFSMLSSRPPSMSWNPIFSMHPLTLLMTLHGTLSSCLTGHS